MFVLAHLSDIHLDGGPRALDRTRRVMAYLRGLPIDAILVTGDIADHGAPEEYRQAREVLAADVPVLVLPGNHDAKQPFRTVLLGADGTGPVDQVRRVGAVTFALCDSTIPRRNEGLLAPQTLTWLRRVIEDADGPVFVCLHHPPVPVHHPVVDGIGLTNDADLAELIRDDRRVAAVLCGHAHTAATATFAGRPVRVAPGVVSTLRLPWTMTQPVTMSNLVDLEDPPSVAFHVLGDDGSLTTHYRVAPATVAA
ncbi:MAG TPA: metallophosphoesterase [Micromonosporaceae bacterium]